ncbi:hypothetical protein UMZ34_21225 [Halopseudomonas pachastrellae]|nr:hypothetical protein UMZ34_21225 [Halopseudomonas pachastrellae]
MDTVEALVLVMAEQGCQTSYRPPHSATLAIDSNVHANFSGACMQRPIALEQARFEHS